jgi:hypothetical protein
MGYVKAMRHIAERDRPYIHNSGVILNLLFSRVKYKGTKVVDHFKPLGDVYFSSPLGASADLHGVPKNGEALTNALFLKALKPKLDAGGVELDVALNGSEVKSEFVDEEFSHYRIPGVQPSSADLIKYFDDAVAVTLVGPPILDRWQLHISDLLDVQELLKTHNTGEVTDMLYAHIRESLEKATRKDVSYTAVAQQIGKASLSD